MTQEKKDLLIKDLCARLPYEVKVQYEDGIFTIDYISGMYEEVKLNTPNNYTIDILEVKPYLFPLSSMTEEQKKEFKKISKCKDEITNYGGFDSEGVYLIEIGEYEYEYDLDTTVEEFYFNHEIIDWFNKNHFDWRGLIPMGLAIDATNLNIY